MEATENPNTLQRIGGLSQLHFVRQLVLMGGIAASIALGVAVVLWSQAAPYKLLYSGLSPEHNAKVTASLEQNGLEYQVDQRTGGISVPAADVHRTRLILARSGLPPKANKGFAILDQKSTLGTSNFMEQARYTRALQEELVLTIESMEHIREARVHLSIPKQTTFLRSRLQPSASIMLSLYPGAQLTDRQIAGLKHLVAASTAGLAQARVSVVDQQGNLLSADADSPLAIGRTHLRLKDQLEQQYASRIVNILTPIVGVGRVRAQVSAKLDFTQVETTREEYEPTTVLRSEQTDSEQTSMETESAGVPGLLANDPNGSVGIDGAQAGSAKLRKKSSSTRNYEVDRSVSHIKSTPGSIARLSVAVLVDYQQPGTASNADEKTTERDLSPEQHARLVELVKQTIGFDESRGDSVSVVDSEFIVPVEPELPVLEAALLDNPMLWSALRQAGAALVVLIIIFGVLRPILRSSVAVENSLPQRRLAAQSPAQPWGNRATRIWSLFLPQPVRVCCRPQVASAIRIILPRSTRLLRANRRELRD